MHPQATAKINTHRIRSYVKRAGRISKAQQIALDTLWPIYGVEYSGQHLDWPILFKPAENVARPTVLEIGFGMGETTAEIAAAHAEINFLAIDVHTPGVGALLKQIGERQLDNLRLMRHDAVDVLTHMIAPASLAGIHIFFPDPWHKARHHKRRLMQAPFVHLLTSRLNAQGYLHCATDWQDYAQQMQQVLSAEPLLVNTQGDFAPGQNPLIVRPQTKFEQRGLRLGYGVWDIVFKRRPLFSN